METILPGSCRRSNSFQVLIALLALTISLALALAANGQSLAKISTDTFTNSDSTHRTEVEPSTLPGGTRLSAPFTWGGGRGRSAGVAPMWALPLRPTAAADPSVAYDAKHGQWLISTLPLVGLNGSARYIGDVTVSSSRDGLKWGNPINIDNTHLARPR
jgi:hypothetical protein